MMTRTACSLILAASLAPCHMSAQTCVQSARIVRRPEASGSASKADLNVNLFEWAPESKARANLTYLPSGITEDCQLGFALIGNATNASCALVRAPDEIHEFHLSVTVTPSSGAAKVCNFELGAVELAGSKEALSRAYGDFQKAIEAAKPSAEKNLFAALNGSAASGTTAGDLIFSTTVSPTQGVLLNLALNRSSLEQADVKQLDLGIGLRRAIPIYLSGKADVSSATSPEAKYQAAMQARIVNLLLDGFARYEGDATRFEVTNAIADIPIQFSSRVMGFGPVARDGFWKWRLMPIGVEAGKNLGSTNPNLKEYKILRSKHGGSFSLRFAPPSISPVKVELEAEAAARYLKYAESAWDQTKNSPIEVTSGWKPYADVSLKVFLVQSDKALFGFRVNYTRGGLPPVFNETKAFRFGVLIESRDGDGPKK